MSSKSHSRPCRRFQPLLLGSDPHILASAAFIHIQGKRRGFPGISVLKNPPANVGDAEDSGSIPGSGRLPPRRKMATRSSILAWEILWTEEPGGLQSMGHKESDTTEHTYQKGRGREKAQRAAAINATSSSTLSDTSSLSPIRYYFDLSHIISFSCLLCLPCSQVSKSPTGRSSKSNQSIWETVHTLVIHTTYEAIRNRRN